MDIRKRRDRIVTAARHPDWYPFNLSTLEENVLNVLSQARRDELTRCAKVLCQGCRDDLLSVQHEGRRSHIRYEPEVSYEPCAAAPILDSFKTIHQVRFEEQHRN